MSSIIIGIDPGLRLTGYAVLQLPGAGASPTADPGLVEAGVFRLEAKRSMTDRLAMLHEDLCALLDEHAPDEMAVEQLYAHYDHPRTAVLMAHARGVILLAGAQREIAIKDIEATAVKKAVTGYGHATKEQIQRAVAGVFGLDAPPSPPDVADAMAIALTHARRVMLDRAMVRKV